MRTPEENRETHVDQPQKSGEPKLAGKPLTFEEQMAKDMAAYYEGDKKRSALMLDYLASLQKEDTRPH